MGEEPTESTATGRSVTMGACGPTEILEALRAILESAGPIPQRPGVSLVATRVIADARALVELADRPNAHTLTLEFWRYLTEAEWREVVVQVRAHIPYVQLLRAAAERVTREALDTARPLIPREALDTPLAHAAPPPARLDPGSQT